MSASKDEILITHHVIGQGGRYIAHVGREKAEAYLDWEPGEPIDGRELRVATHTLVPRALEGRGIGSMLVERLVADAREQGFYVLPRCSFVAAKFDERQDWRDVLAPERS